MNGRSRFTALALVVACTVSACSPGSGSGASSTKATKDLEVVSWWTSGSEQQALGVLMDSYREGHADVTVTNAAVAGGGGGNAQVVLAQRLLGGTPPDSWQTFPGQALARYVDTGAVADVSPLYAQGLAAATPKVILDGLTVGGKQYGVPTSAHRGNMLFFNRAVLERAGVRVPTDGYTADAFADDLAAVRKSGATPLCLGAKDRFTSAALFENVLLSVVGPQGWAQITSDRFDWDGAQAREALQRFGAILDDADPAAAALSWDAATKKLASGGCGYETLNDSAYGELLKTGAVDGKDFGEVAYPGTGSVYVAVVDTFVEARRAANGKNAADFLTTIADPGVQVAFSRAKGSVPVRTDADVSSLTPYQQSAAKALRSDTVLWSIVHGSAMRPQFQQGFYDAVETYVRSRDPRAFSATLTDAMSQQVPSK